MVGFIDPVGTSFQSASAERSEQITSSMRRKTFVSCRIFLRFIVCRCLYGWDRTEARSGGTQRSELALHPKREPPSDREQHSRGPRPRPRPHARTNEGVLLNWRIATLH